MREGTQTAPAPALADSGTGSAENNGNIVGWDAAIFVRFTSMECCTDLNTNNRSSNFVLTVLL